MVIFHFSSHPDGTDIIDYKPKRHRLQVNVTEVGSEREISNNGQYMQVNRRTLQKYYYLELIDDWWCADVIKQNEPELKENENLFSDLNVYLIFRAILLKALSK